jgi:hypothetical protein
MKHQRQLQASGVGKPHAVILASAPTINRIGAALKNMALAVLNETTVLQQLMAANLVLTGLVTLVTMANKKAHGHFG